MAGGAIGQQAEPILTTMRRAFAHSGRTVKVVAAGVDVRAISSSGSACSGLRLVCEPYLQMRAFRQVARLHMGNAGRSFTKGVIATLLRDKSEEKKRPENHEMQESEKNVRPAGSKGQNAGRERHHDESQIARLETENERLLQNDVGRSDGRNGQPDRCERRSQGQIEALLQIVAARGFDGGDCFRRQHDQCNDDAGHARWRADRRNAGTDDDREEFGEQHDCHQRHTQERTMRVTSLPFRAGISFGALCSPVK